MRTLSSDHFHQCRTCQRPCDNHPRPQPVQYKKAGKLWLFFQHLLTKWDSPPFHPPITGQKFGWKITWIELMSSRKPRSDLEAQLLGQSSSSVIFLFNRSKNCKNVNRNLRTLGPLGSRGEWKQDYIQMERENEAPNGLTTEWTRQTLEDVQKIFPTKRWSVQFKIGRFYYRNHNPSTLRIAFQLKI